MPGLVNSQVTVMTVSVISFPRKIAMALIAERDRFDIDERFLWKLHVVTYGEMCIRDRIRKLLEEYGRSRKRASNTWNLNGLIGNQNIRFLQMMTPRVKRKP